jgi:hypothetical protein
VLHPAAPILLDPQTFDSEAVYSDEGSSPSGEPVRRISKMTIHPMDGTQVHSAED